MERRSGGVYGEERGSERDGEREVGMERVRRKREGEREREKEKEASRVEGTLRSANKWMGRERQRGRGKER